MAVAWIGNREAPVEHAAEHAAALLASSRCPVISFDTDIHGTRAAIALAERVGAAYDHLDGKALALEAALFTDKGGMFVAPGEVRRRADVIVVVGELPEVHHGLVAELAETAPDFSSASGRAFFLIGNAETPTLPLGDTRKAILLLCGADLGATLAALRAQCAGRQVAARVENFDRFVGALAAARFPVFLFSSHTAGGLALEMLQGLIADLNNEGRASALHLPVSESGWGAVLASTWMTGFPPRASFARGFPEFDPWRFDVARMLAGREADCHLWISARESLPLPESNGVPLIVLAKTSKPVTGAEVTIAIGEARVDHDAVVYSARTGSLRSVAARSASQQPSAATVLRLIAGHVAAEAPSPC